MGPISLNYLFIVLFLFQEGCLVAARRVSEAEKTATMARRLSRLRGAMQKHGLAAYIVPTGDDHQSEYLCDANKRREYISGFTGSAGTALITMTDAFLWTDSRYHIQATKELIKELWTVQKDGNKNVDRMDVWINNHFNESDKIGVDPRKVTTKYWDDLQKYIGRKGIELTSVEENLIDEIWDDRPSYPSDPVFIHPIKYAGVEWTDKVEQLREKLTKLHCDCLVETALDNVAWLLNLRGNDVTYSPVFLSFAVVTNSSVELFVAKSKVPEEVTHYLNSSEKIPVRLHEYDSFWKKLPDIVQPCKRVALPSGKYAATSHQVRQIVKCQTHFENVSSPLVEMKSYKNSVEAAGTRAAHIRDAVALCQLMQTMEQEVPLGVYWDELKVVSELEKLRSQQELNRGSSFATISAFGPNSALPHYAVNNETNLRITAEAPLTIDSGGQYLDGTIDTTRVLHFGKPKAEHVEAYTALLAGVADLASTVFPAGATAEKIDFVLRRPLYLAGRDYGHGSTHGTGCYLLVHEAYNGTYHINFVGSQEPGYYKENDFGMRLENLVIVVPSKIKNYTSKDLLTFEPLTLVPYERKLIDPSKLERSQLKWVNDYHGIIRNLVGAEMEKQKKKELYDWLMKATEPIEEK